MYSVDLRVGRGTRTTLAEQIFDLRFRGFRVGAGEEEQTLNRISIFSVFLCDFRVFRVMIRPSKRIPYTKPKYILKFITVILGSLEGFTPPACKSIDLLS